MPAAALFRCISSHARARTSLRKALSSSARNRRPGSALAVRYCVCCRARTGCCMRGRRGLRRRPARRRGVSGSGSRLRTAISRLLCVIAGRLRLTLSDRDFTLTVGEVAEFDTRIRTRSLTPAPSWRPSSCTAPAPPGWPTAARYSTAAAAMRLTPRRSVGSVAFVAELHSENVLSAPSGALRGVVARYNGFSYRGSPGGTHQGLPSRHVTMVVSAGSPVVVDRSAGLDGDGAFLGLVAGLRSRPLAVRNQGEGSGVIVSLSPLGARRLFGGLPAGVIAGRIVPLDRLLGPAGVELQERVAEAKSCPARFAVLDETLHRVLLDRAGPPAEVCDAWRRLVATGGQTRVGALAAETGWSRRHLERRFRDELGLGVKEAARVLRFERTVAALDQRPGRALAGLAAECGYYDQAHLANEWRRLAGVSVTEWLRQELRDPPPHLAVA